MGITGVKVIKRSGQIEPYNIEKIHRVLQWATDGINGVSISAIEINTNLNLYDGIKTTDIHELLIKSAVELITEDTPNYQYVAARLVNIKLRKEVYNSYIPCSLFDLIQQNVNRGIYDSDILIKYTKAEINWLDSHINHDRDGNFTYAAMQQLRSKYLVQDRTTGQIFETPQSMYMLIGMCLHIEDHTNTPERLHLVKQFYDAVSQFYISLPTPIMAGVRTREKQYSSCVLIDVDDSLNSISASTTAIIRYISNRAGIGLNIGRIRAVGSKVANGEKMHTGIIPYIKLFHAAVKSCSQGGIRGGSATLNYPIWHYEFDNLIVLKNNKGTEETRVRHVDYAVQINGYMYQRLIHGGNITFFSPKDVPGLYEAFFSNQKEFARLYELYEVDSSIRKKTLPAIDVFRTLIMERQDTGRIYIMNVDNVNNHSTYDEKQSPIYMTNLCLTGDTKVDAIVNNISKYDLRMDELNRLYHQGNEIQVFSYDEKTKTGKYKKVIDSALTSLNANIIKITDISTGRNIKCTPEHEIFTQNRGYIMAKNLEKTDQLLTPESMNQKLEKEVFIHLEYLNKTEEVYDISVEHTHNFFANYILVHNCAEITLPTKPMNDITDENSLIALCTLSAINWGQINDPSEFSKYAKIIVRALDNLLSLQDYPFPAAKNSAHYDRPLGIGITNLAYFLAKRGLSYSDPAALPVIDEYAEAWSYALLDASADLAKERGLCQNFDKTKYADHLLPLDTAAKTVNELVPMNLRCTWDNLRDKIQSYGIRNSTLMALMPVESSSQVTNSTNGIEPPRGLVSYKVSKDGVIPMVVPGIHRLKNKYELLWDMPSPRGYLNICAVLQRWIDQAISVNTSYNPMNYPNKKIPMTELMGDLIRFWKYGGKNLYYHNTYDMAGEIEVNSENECESCTV